MDCAVGYGFPRNRWFSNLYIDLYMRNGVHCLDGIGIEECIDVASVTVHKPGRGIFKAYLSAIESLAQQSDRIVYVENVLNERLADFLKRRGYAQKEQSFYKRLTNEAII